MLVILHGDNVVLSRNRLNLLIDQIKKTGVKDIVHLNGKKLNLNEVLKACESGSLFGTDKLIIIEDLFKNLSKENLKEITTYLSAINHLPLASIIIYSQKSLTATQLKPFSKFQIEIFKTSPSIFKFLDGIGINPLKQQLALLQESVHLDSPEFVFFMLGRHITSLIQSTDNAYKTSPWQLTKLKNQYQKVGEINLLNLHQKLYKLDYSLKTGQTVLDLKGELELLLLKQ